MTNDQKAYGYAGLSILFWATVASAFKIALRSVDYISLLFFSIITSFFVLGIILLVQGRLKGAFYCSPKQYLQSAIIGFINPAVYYLILFKAYSLLPAQLAQPLNFTWPVVLVLLAVPLKGEKLTPLGLMALLISFLGVVFISSEGKWFSFNLSEPLGVILALGSSVFWALSWIYNSKDRRDPVVKLFLNFFFAACAVSVLYFTRSPLAFPDRNGLLACVYIGLFEMGLTFVFWLKALENTSHTQIIGNLIYLTPFFSLLVIRLVLHEQIYMTSLVGLCLIAAGIILQKKTGSAA